MIVVMRLTCVQIPQYSDFVETYHTHSMNVKHAHLLEVQRPGHARGKLCDKREEVVDPRCEARRDPPCINEHC